MTTRSVWVNGTLAAILLLGAAAGPTHGAAAPGTQLAASGAEDTGSADAGAAERLDTTDSYRLTLLKMKGQLSVARALLQIRADGADYHMRQPVQDIFEAAKAEFERRRAPFTADTLEELEHAPTDEPVIALTTIESAVTAINGSFAQTGAMSTESVLALSEALLRAAVAKYTDAVVDNEVVDLRKYQSGRGFVTVAEALVRHSSGLKGRPGHEDLLRAVVLIRQAWPGVIPPPIVFGPESVAGRLEQAVAAMDELR